MLSLLLCAATLAPHVPARAGARGDDPFATGGYTAHLASPGGRLDFGLALARRGDALTAELVNGPERIPVASARRDGEQLVLRFDPYDSELRLARSADSAALTGTWTKRSGARVVRMDVHAEHVGDPSPARPGPAPQAGSTPGPVHGRWAVEFSSSEDPAVAVFSGAAGEPRITGTFLTTLGDYRFLDGAWDAAARTLTLSCFDGAHAFLFRARLLDDGSLAGDFWSSDRWHETWTAVRDEHAALPDPFAITAWNRDVRLADLRFPDLEGVPRALDEPDFAGKARIVELFGTWCPNCNDEAAYLAELDRRYRARGLAILGLAFEHDDDHAYAAGRVRSYAERHGVEFPILVAGTSDKQEASAAFPLLDRVRAYPTTMFLDAGGRVRAVHTGFAGPAAGAEHDKLREDFERLIEELLAEAGDGE